MKCQFGITSSGDDVSDKGTAIVGTVHDIKTLIYVVCNQQVMLDSDLAVLYQVETKVLNQSVKRNLSRFPEKFYSQLTSDEHESLRSQFVTSSLHTDENVKHGGRRKR